MNTLTRDINLTREDVIKAIKKGLESRSGLKWSITGGTGTAYGWLKIDASPKRRTWKNIPKDPNNTEPGKDNWKEVDEGAGSKWGHTGPGDRKLLAELLALDSVPQQGISVPASTSHYIEYIDRAEGRTPRVLGKIYWD